MHAPEQFSPFVYLPQCQLRTTANRGKSYLARRCKGNVVPRVNHNALSLRDLESPRRAARVAGTPTVSGVFAERRQPADKVDDTAWPPLAIIHRDFGKQRGRHERRRNSLVQHRSCRIKLRGPSREVIRCKRMARFQPLAVIALASLLFALAPSPARGRGRWLGVLSRMCSGLLRVCGDSVLLCSRCELRAGAVLLHSPAGFRRVRRRGRLPGRLCQQCSRRRSPLGRSKRHGPIRRPQNGQDQIASNPYGDPAVVPGGYVR